MFRDYVRVLGLGLGLLSNTVCGDVNVHLFWCTHIYVLTVRRQGIRMLIYVCVYTPMWCIYNLVMYIHHFECMFICCVLLAPIRVHLLVTVYSKCFQTFEPNFKYLN